MERNDYLEAIITQLSNNDLSILNALLTNDATSKYLSLSKKKIMEYSDVKDYSFRKSMERLEALLFLEIAKSNRKYQYFITIYGIQAINKIIEQEEGVEIKC